jgi:hypothetical protein
MDLPPQASTPIGTEVLCMLYELQQGGMMAREFVATAAPVLSAIA